MHDRPHQQVAERALLGVHEALQAFLEDFQHRGNVSGVHRHGEQHRLRTFGQIDDMFEVVVERASAHFGIKAGVFALAHRDAVVDQPDPLDLRVADLPDDAGDRRVEQRVGQRRETLLRTGQRNDLHPKAFPVRSAPPLPL
jgi:hypothetical protein